MTDPRARVLVILLGGSMLACGDAGGGGSDSQATSQGSSSSATDPSSTGAPPPTGGPQATSTGGTDTGDATTTMGIATTGTSTGGMTTNPVVTTGSDTTSGETSGGTTTGEASETGTSSTGGPPPPKCQPSPPSQPAGDCAAVGVVLQPPFDDNYTCIDLGVLPDVPTEWGGLIVDREDPGILLAGGDANTLEGTLYAVGVARDSDCHLLGYTGAPTTARAAAEYNDGGLSYHPGDATLFLARWPVNQLGQLKPGDVATSKVVDLAALGVVSSPGGVTFVPPGFAGEGQLKAVSWPGGEWYTLALAADGKGTYDVTSATMNTKIVGGPEAFVYVSDENPEFAVDGFLVAEWSAGNIAAYDADAKGDPIPATRRDFIVGLNGAESAYIDPLSGDFLFATFAGSERLVVIRGFQPQPQ